MSYKFKELLLIRDNIPVIEKEECWLDIIIDDLAMVIFYYIENIDILNILIGFNPFLKIMKDPMFWCNRLLFNYSYLNLKFLKLDTKFTTLPFINIMEYSTLKSSINRSIQYTDGKINISEHSPLDLNINNFVNRMNRFSYKCPLLDTEFFQGLETGKISDEYKQLENSKSYFEYTLRQSDFYVTRRKYGRIIPEIGEVICAYNLSHNDIINLHLKMICCGGIKCYL